MTRDEAESILQTAARWFGGMDARIVEHPAPGSYAVAIPASESGEDLWFLITEYDVNHIEELEAIARSPAVQRLGLRPAS